MVDDLLMNAETELFEKRRQKLAELVARYETQEEFARAIGKGKSYVSRMLYPPSKSGYKRIGDKMVLAIIIKPFSGLFLRLNKNN